MRNAFGVGLIVALLVICLPAQAAETKIHLELLGGYTLLAENAGDSEVYQRTKSWQRVEVDDESTLDAGPLAGLGLNFTVGDGVARFNYGFEFLWASATGRLRGNYTLIDAPVDLEFRENYSLWTLQLDLLVGVEFVAGDVHPYLKGGLGPVFSDIDFGGDTHQAYSLAFTIVGGFDYMILDWLSLGAQLRFTDLRELGYDYIIGDTLRVNYEPEFLTLGALGKIGFHF